jgi:hypothetical protein
VLRRCTDNVFLFEFVGVAPSQAFDFMIFLNSFRKLQQLDLVGDYTGPTGAGGLNSL